MRRLLGLVLLLTSVACSKDSSTNPTTASLAGTWNLSTVNDLPLPFLLQEFDPLATTPTPKIELLSDQIVATASGTFVETASARITDANGPLAVSFSDNGTWALNGNTINFHFASDGSTGTGTLSGNTLTIGEGPFKSVYLKQ
jgi:hypothetical protein